MFQGLRNFEVSLHLGFGLMGWHFPFVLSICNKIRSFANMYAA